MAYPMTAKTVVRIVPLTLTGDLIADLYVRPDLLRRGYGWALLRYAESVCSKTPHLTVLSSNRGAISFYKRMGYAATGQKRILRENLFETELKKDQTWNGTDY